VVKKKKPPVYFIISAAFLALKNGEPGGIRTLDHKIVRSVLTE
jgi:hypothetical protein